MRSNFLRGQATVMVLAGCVIAACGAAAEAGTVRYVNDDAAPGGNGLSWATAYQSLTDAINASSGGDEIWVAVGRYEPAGIGGDRAASFTLPPDVPVYGGFLGNETSLAERAGLFEDTLLSGDLNRDDAGLYTNTSDNSYHVVRIDQSGCTLDGFNIAFGNADDTVNGNASGAGILISFGAAGVVANCIIQANSAGQGGGVNDGGGSLFRRCVFLYNRSLGSSGGGALLAYGAAAPLLDSCRFQFNTAFGAAAGGGAISAYEVNGKNCLFQGNICDATSSGGGGAVAYPASATFVNCIFVGNKSNAVPGGGGAIRGNGLKLYNCVFSGNTAAATTAGGGAVQTDASTSSIVNCTFTANSSFKSGSAGGLHTLGPVNIRNSIFHLNTNPGGSSQAAQISGSGGISINHSCVQGWTGSLGGVGNFGSNPHLSNPSGVDRTYGTPDDEPALLLNSPCIDAGDSAALPADVLDIDNDGNTSEPLPLDFLNATRRTDDFATTDTGTGGAPVVDIGAYEFAPPIARCPSDFDGSGFVDFDDFNAFVAAFEAGC